MREAVAPSARHAAVWRAPRAGRTPAPFVRGLRRRIPSRLRSLAPARSSSWVGSSEHAGLWQGSCRASGAPRACLARSARGAPARPFPVGASPPDPRGGTERAWQRRLRPPRPRGSRSSAGTVGTRHLAGAVSHGGTALSGGEDCPPGRLPTASVASDAFGAAGPPAFVGLRPPRTPAGSSEMVAYGTPRATERLAGESRGREVRRGRSRAVAGLEGER